MAFGPKFPLSVVLQGDDRLSGALGKVGGRLDALHFRAQRVGKALTTRLTLPLFAVGAAAVKVGSDVEKALVQVGAQTGATEEQLRDLRQLWRDIGEGPPFDVRTVGQASAALADQALILSEINDVLVPMERFAAAVNAELEDTAPLGAAISRSFRKVGDQVTTAFNDAAFAINQSRLTTEGLFQLVERAGPVVRGADGDFRDLVSSAAIFAEEGFAARQAVSSLTLALGKLTALTPATVKGLATLGLGPEDFQDAEGRFIGLARSLNKLRDAGAGAPILAQIFGEDVAPRLRVLLTDAGDRILAFQERMDAATGFMEDRAAKRVEGLSGALNGLVGAAQSLLDALAEAGILQALTGLAKGTADWIRKVNKSNPELFKWATRIGAIAALAGPVVLGLAKLIAVTVKLGGVMAKAGAIVKGVALLFTGPWGIAIAGAIALGAALVTNWDKVIATAKKLWGWISKKLAPAIESLSKWWANLVKVGSTFLDEIGLGDGGTRTARAPGPGGAPVGGERIVTESRTREERRSTVTVEFPNLPAGARLHAVGDVDLDMSMGPAMVAG